MKRAIILAVLIPLFALGCAQEKRLKVTYRSDPPGGELYKLNGEFWGPCPKVLWYDLDHAATSAGYLEAKGLIVRWPSGPESKSDRLLRIPVDGTDQHVTFVQPKDTPDAAQVPEPAKGPQHVATGGTVRPDPQLREEVATEGAVRPDPQLREEVATEGAVRPAPQPRKEVVTVGTVRPDPELRKEVATGGALRSDPELREEKDDETVWIRQRTGTVDPPSVVAEPQREEAVKVDGTFKDVDFGDGVTVEFALIPAGELVIDSSSNNGGTNSHKGRVRTLRIDKPFYMSIYEVTQELYEKVMKANPSRYPGQTYPVDTVSWNDAERFCRILSSKGKGRCLLPTESQWEYACRAGATTAYYWGDTFDARYAWVITNSDSSTHEVGTVLPNAWGLYDMAGNVWEWCQNWYGQSDPNSAEQTPSKGKYRILRGGSWGHAPSSCRSAARNWHTPNHRYDDCGFRIVLEAE